MGVFWKYLAIVFCFNQKTSPKKRTSPNFSTFYAEQAARLMALGFVWAPHKAAWEVQLARLAAYKAAHGDCSVPHCCVPRTSGSVTGLGTSG
jgi:hypothetical protein